MGRPIRLFPHLLVSPQVFTPAWWRMRAEVHADAKAHTRGGAAVIE